MAGVVEENQSIIDLGDVDSYVSASDFSDYMAANLQMSEKTAKNFTVFWNEKYDESNCPQALLSSSSQSGSLVKEKIKTAFQRLGFSRSQYILVQFWALVTIEGRQILTTSDQPFGMTRLRNGLCRYKKFCASSNYGAEGEGRGNFLTGPPSRVVQNGFPEYSPNIQFYSTQEFPLRDDAESCKISNYLALPVFETSSQLCGVLELVASSGSDVMMKLTHLIKQISATLEGVELRTFVTDTPFDKKKISTGQNQAFREIRRGLQEVTRTHYLPFAQTWTPRPDSSSAGRATLTARERSLVAGPASGVLSVFGEACNNFGLMKGKGVVWSAFSSQTTCFCGDITQLRITEYPFVHVANVLGLRSSLAICLQSNHTEDNMYVLEFFLPWYENRDPRTWLGLLASTMKRYLNSFKFASGQELGEGLCIEVIGNLEGQTRHHRTAETSVRQEAFQEKYGTVLREHKSGEHEAFGSPASHALPESFPKDVTRISNLQPKPKLYNTPDFTASDDLFSSEFFQGDSTNISNVQSTSETFPEIFADVSDGQSFGGTSNGSNAFIEENVFADCSYVEWLLREGERTFGRSVVNLEDTSDIQPVEEGTQAESKSKEINRQLLEQHFGLKREDAAHSLGVSTSTLKRKCREHGIPRWPSGKRKLINSSPSHNHNGTQTSDWGPEGLHPNLSSKEATTSSAGRSSNSGAQSFLQEATTENRGTINSGGTTSSAPSSSQAATMDNRGIMTVKAEYEGKKIKFQLPLSSRMIDLENEIAMSLKLKVGKFYISYLDEDDEWILLTRDADLRIVESMGNTIIRMSITNKVRFLDTPRPPRPWRSNTM